MESRGVVTFGEIMLRLSPQAPRRLIQADRLEVGYGGAEANVAVALAQLSHDSVYVTRLPQNALGDQAFQLLRGFGVDVRFILRGGERIGLYFLEHGASLRPSRVIYDRNNSSIAQIRRGMLDWEKIFDKKQWFHFTGITPALSAGCADVCLEALETARKMGLRISCDINYRKKLWSRESAQKTMSRLLQYVDVLIANEQDAQDVFGIEAAGSDPVSGVIDPKSYHKVAKKLAGIGNASCVAITLRASGSASDNRWSALAYDGQSCFHSRQYDIHIVDRVGGGDAFGAGFIHGFLCGWPVQKSLEFGVAASAWKQTIPGDFNLFTEDEILQVMKGDVSGRVQR